MRHRDYIGTRWALNRVGSGWLMCEVSPRARSQARSACHPLATLVSLMGVRDAAAVETDSDVYARLAPELIRFATGLVGATDAADVLSNAVVRALAAATWPTVTNRRAYLYRAVFNEAHTWRHRSRQRREREALAASPERWELPSFRPEVRTAVERLSVRQRAVIVLTYWADLGPAEVAARLGLSEGTVKRHLARARARLREVLDV